MKKILILLSFISYIPFVSAISINLESMQTFYPSQGIVKSKSVNINSINTSDREFSLILPKDSNIRFSGDLSGIIITGSGSTKIGTGSFIESNLSVLHFYLSDNLNMKDNIIINGLKLIVYSRPQGDRYLGIDVDGDNIIDGYSSNGYRVNSIYAYSDKLAPSEVFNLTGSINNNEIILSADMPGDIDFQGILIENLDKYNKVISSFFRRNLDNFKYNINKDFYKIKIKTVDLRAHYSKGLIFDINYFKNIDNKPKNIIIKSNISIIQKVKEVIKIDKISKYTGMFSDKNQVILNNFVNIIDNFISKNQKIDISIKGENDLMIIRNNIVKELEKFDISMSLKEKKIIIKNMVKLIKELKKAIIL